MFDLRDYVRKAFKFMIVGAIGAVANLALLFFFVQYLKIYYVLADIIAIIIVFGLNFNGNILMKNIKNRKN